MSLDDGQNQVGCVMYEDGIFTEQVLPHDAWVPAATEVTFVVYRCHVGCNDKLGNPLFIISMGPLLTKKTPSQVYNENSYTQNTTFLRRMDCEWFPNTVVFMEIFSNRISWYFEEYWILTVSKSSNAYLYQNKQVLNAGHWYEEFIARLLW